MASIHKDPRGYSKYWYAAYRTSTGQRRFVSTRETDREKARIIANAFAEAERVASRGGSVEEKIRQILNETLERAGLRKVEVVRLEEWLDSWLASRRKLAQASRIAYRQAFDEFLRFMGSRRNAPLESVTELDISRFKDFLLSSGRSNSTVEKISRQLLGVPFSKAAKLGKIRFNPVAACEPLPDDKTSRGVFSALDVVRLIEAAPTNDWKGAITLGYCSAMRLRDITNLEWRAIDTEHGLICFLEGKKKKQSFVGLHPDFAEWLTAQPVADDQTFVFPSLAGRMSHDLSRRFSGIVAVAGIENRVTKKGSGKGRTLSALTFHALRHTATSATYNAAAAEDIARKVSGHSGEVIKDYIHVDAENLKAAVNLIPRLPKR